MPKPSLLQTLFNRPSQAYSSPDPYDPRPLRNARSSSALYDTRSQGTSIRSGSSTSSVTDLRWEWTKFGSRRPTTDDDAGSVRTMSERGQVRAGGRRPDKAPSIASGSRYDWHEGFEDDSRSMRSSRSLSSLRGKKSSSTRSDLGNLTSWTRDEPALDQSASSRERTLGTSRKYSTEEPSRRYSSSPAPSLPFSRRPSSITSTISDTPSRSPDKPRRSKKSSPLNLVAEEDSSDLPSLAASASSSSSRADSIECPVTPIMNSPAGVPKKKKRKKVRVVEEMEQVQVQEVVDPQPIPMTGQSMALHLIEEEEEDEATTDLTISRALLGYSRFVQVVERAVVIRETEEPFFDAIAASPSFSVELAEIAEEDEHEDSGEDEHEEPGEDDTIYYDSSRFSTVIMGSHDYVTSAPPIVTPPVAPTFSFTPPTPQSKTYPEKQESPLARTQSLPPSPVVDSPLPSDVAAPRIHRRDSLKDRSERTTDGAKFDTPERRSRRASWTGGDAVLDLSSPERRRSISQRTKGSPLTTANLASVVAPPFSSPYGPKGSVVSETPQWLRAIRALGEPIDAPRPIPSTSLSRKTASSFSSVPEHLSGFTYERASSPKLEESLSRRSSTKSPMGASPEVKAVEVALASASSTPRSSVSASSEPTVPRRKVRPRSTSMVEHVAFPRSTPAGPSPPSTTASFHTVSESRSTGLAGTAVPTGAYVPHALPSRLSTMMSRKESLDFSSTTMNALSVCSNATAALTRSSFPLFRRTPPSPPKLPAHLRRSFLPSRDLTVGPSPPPKDMKRDELLVEVLAVGVDQVDVARVKELAAGAGYGWIPGRSFAGRVIEVGIEVTRLAKGDYVFGLADMKKSGALAELLVIQKDLVALCPDCGISVEQIAALPLGGIHAVQIMELLCDELPKGSKVLILAADEPTGSLCLQLAAHFRATRDLWILAQSTSSTNIADILALSASDVSLSTPLACLAELHESSFDAIVDTTGSVEVFKASRRVLHAGGRFITTRGDKEDNGVSTQWKLGIRGLRSNFLKKDRKSVSYWPVHLDLRENPREALDKLRDAVERSKVLPPISKVVNLDNAASAFDEGDAVTVVRMD